MASITWPAAAVLIVLALCASGLAWKGVVPSHVFIGVAGAILGYLIPKSRALSPEVKRKLQEYNESFTQDEVPTNPGSHGVLAPEEPKKKEEKTEEKK
jgi:hypothetical protein